MKTILKIIIILWVISLLFGKQTTNTTNVREIINNNNADDISGYLDRVEKGQQATEDYYNQVMDENEKFRLETRSDVIRYEQYQHEENLAKINSDGSNINVSINGGTR